MAKKLLHLFKIPSNICSANQIMNILLKIGSLFETRNTYISNHLFNLMQAGENLCSLKSRNNCIMRRKIVDIYKALRHFHVTAEEVRDIAEGYRYWIANPFESRPLFNTVYCFDGKLYSLPYPDDLLKDHFVGIEIECIVYLKQYICAVTQDGLNAGVETIKNRLAEKFEELNRFKLRMPTRYEAKFLPKKTEGNRNLNGVVFNKYGDVWITPMSDHPERTFATVGEGGARPHQPSENTRATLYLVTDPDDEQIFYGDVDEYGTPTAETQEVYYKLGTKVVLSRQN